MITYIIAKFINFLFFTYGNMILTREKSIELFSNFLGFKNLKEITYKKCCIKKKGFEFTFSLIVFL